MLWSECQPSLPQDLKYSSTGPESISMIQWRDQTLGDDREEL